MYYIFGQLIWKNMHLEAQANTHTCVRMHACTHPFAATIILLFLKVELVRDTHVH